MHVEKYQRSAVGHMLRHYNRKAVHFGNREIDNRRSASNYNLAPKRQESDIDYYRGRLSKVKCQNRADVKTLCDWIITLPKKGFSEAQESLFFRTAYDFLAKRYREENVISAWVHKDESGQPHLHFAFIPVCIDTRKGIEKVSAKEVLTRTELKAIHGEMADCMERVFGCEVGILNGATAGGNKTVMELKGKKIQDQVETLEEIKKQTITELAETIKRKPKLLRDISRAVKIACGKEEPQIKKRLDRILERGR